MEPAEFYATRNFWIHARARELELEALLKSRIIGTYYPYLYTPLKYTLIICS